MPDAILYLLTSIGFAVACPLLVEHLGDDLGFVVGLSCVALALWSLMVGWGHVLNQPLGAAT